MVHFDDSFSNAKLKELHAHEEERVAQKLASQLGYEYVNLRHITVNPEAVVLIPEKRAKESLAVAFTTTNFNVSIATTNPNAIVFKTLLQNLEAQKLKPKIYVCSAGSLSHAWNKYADVIHTTAEQKGVLVVDAADIRNLTDQITALDDVGKLLVQKDTNSQRHISQTLSTIFAGALALKASDIHIEPEEAGVRLRYRLDGVLHDVADLDNYIYKRLMSRLKLLSGMVLNVKAEAQDGRFSFNSGEKEVEIRSSVIPGALGESIVMRILDPTVASFSLETINLNKHIEKVLRQQLKRPNGLIITTGPTGSGKTTALYAFLQEVHDESKKIITIENPVEYKLAGIMHTQTDADYTFAKGLRAILRQDPDVIMVGEIRDQEVAETAMHAAQTGHLVFSTLHTNNAIAGFTRLIDLGVNPQVLGTSINMILGQRLVRILCDDCKAAHHANAEELQFMKEVMAEHPYPVPVADQQTIYRAVGCPKCNHTGFRGRAAVFEGIVMDETVEEVILRDPRESAIQTAAKPQKIPTMLQDGIEKVLAGITSLTELERVVEFPIKLVTTPNQQEHLVAEGEITNEDFQSRVI